MKKPFIACLLLLLLTHTVFAQKELTRDERMKWWREARFGMFIHWGDYAGLGGVYKGHEVGRGGEWIMNRGKIPVAEYQQFAKQFNPVKYDPMPG
jgi:alpha-L-fucosidase